MPSVFGMSQQEIHDLCHIDPWFLAQIADLVETEKTIAKYGRKKPSADTCCAPGSARDFPIVVWRN